MVTAEAAEASDEVGEPRHSELLGDDRERRVTSEHAAIDQAGDHHLGSLVPHAVRVAEEADESGAVRLLPTDIAPAAGE